MKRKIILTLTCWLTAVYALTATTHTATSLGMVADDANLSGRNTAMLQEALNKGVTDISFDGSFHVNASQGIPVNRPIRLRGGQLIIHRNGKDDYRLFKVMSGLSVHADGVSFTGSTSSAAGYSLHFSVFSNTRSHQEKERITGDLGTLSFSRCKIKDIALLRMTQKVTDSSGQYADVGVDSILIKDNEFDVRTFATISFDGGLIRKSCEVAGNKVTNLSGVFFNHNTTHEGDWKQNTRNAPILFHDNHITTAQPACNYYVCALLVTSRSAHVYNNVFENFLGICYTRGDFKLMDSRDDLRDIIVREASCTNAGDDLKGIYGACLYEVYLSCEEVYFHDNLITNMLAYRLAGNRTPETNPKVSTCYAKNCAHISGHAQKRIIRNNRWVWDETYCRKLLGNAWETQYKRLARAKGETPVDKETWIRQQYFTRLFNYVTSFDEVVFKDNEVDIRGGSITGISLKGSPNAIGRFEFSGNTIRANQITGALCRFLPPTTSKTIEESQLDAVHHDGKSLRQWMRAADPKTGGKNLHAHSINKEGTAGFLVRYVAPGGKVVRAYTTPLDKNKKATRVNTYFINDDITLTATEKDDGTAPVYQLAEQSHPDAVICDNRIQLSGNPMPVILFRAVCNYPFQGEGSRQAYRHWVYGNITVERNHISGANYIIDPGRAKSLSERGNTCQPAKGGTKRKPSILDIRNFTQQTVATTILPANNHEDYQLRIFLDGLKGTHVYQTAFEHTPSHPLSFMMYHDGDKSYHLSVEYKVKGKKKNRELIFGKKGTSTVVTGMKNGKKTPHSLPHNNSRQKIVDDDLTISIEPYNPTTAMTVIHLHNKAEGKQIDGPVTIRWSNR